jgi:hypothetical protein
MIWTVVYSRKAHADFRRLRLEDASNLCGAVHALATARATAVEVDPNDPSSFRLPAEGGFVTVRIDDSTKTIDVLRLVSEGPLDAAPRFLDETEPPPSSA